MTVDDFTREIEPIPTKLLNEIYPKEECSLCKSFAHRILINRTNFKLCQHCFQTMDSIKLNKILKELTSK